MHASRKRVLKLARGYRGRTKNCFTLAIRAVHRAQQYAYISRRLKKRNFRTEWIQRINAGARLHGIKYAHLVRFLPAAGIELNRAMLSTLANTEPFTFKACCEAAKLQMEVEAKAKLAAKEEAKREAEGKPSDVEMR
jgi:large subunit ribosomal protein L20